MEISLKDYEDKAKKLYGETIDFKFKCPNCKRIQSAQSIKKQMEKGKASQRYGIVDVYTQNIYPESACYSPTCNWVANGLFTSNILVIIDISKPHNEALKENCSFVFPLADDNEMLKEAGVEE